MSAVFRLTLLLVAICVASTTAQLVGTPPACDSYTWTAGSWNSSLEDCTSFTGAVILDGTTASNTTFLSKVTSVGSLKINNNPALNSIDLGALTNIDGTLTITNNANLTAVSLGQLTEVDNTVTINNLGNFTALSLPKLALVDGDFLISAVKSFPAAVLLKNVTGKFSYVSGGETGAFALPGVLAYVGSLELKDNTFTSFSGATLTEVLNDLTFSGNNLLTGITFTKLTTVNGSLSLQGPALYSLSFPELKNATVSKLELPELSCTQAAALFAQVYSPEPAGLQCTNAIKCHPALVAPTNGGLPASYNNTFGAPAQNVTCNNGFQVSGASRLCQADGTWSGTVDQTCQQCGAGTFHSGEDALPCANCADDHFSAAGAASCTACPAGTYAGGATPGRTMCYCKTETGYAAVGDAACKKASGASTVTVPVAVLAALAGLTVMVNRA